jgi:hypothetical protein
VVSAITGRNRKGDVNQIAFRGVFGVISSDGSNRA